jgi:hypothetical protein
VTFLTKVLKRQKVLVFFEPIIQADYFEFFVVFFEPIIQADYFEFINSGVLSLFFVKQTLLNGWVS